MSLRKEKFLALASIDYEGMSIKELRALFRKTLESGMHGLCSSPYEEGQEPGDVLTEEQVRRRLNIIKPYTSRYANSEKYVVCKNFIYANSNSYYEILYETFNKMVDNKGEKKVLRFFNIPLNYNFVIKMEEYNAVFGQQQIENIHYTISLIENKFKQEKIDKLLKINVSKCIYWCNKHTVPCNKDL